jgi:hypothetical protein
MEQGDFIERSIALIPLSSNDDFTRHDSSANDSKGAIDMKIDRISLRLRRTLACLMRLRESSNRPASTKFRLTLLALVAICLGFAQEAKAADVPLIETGSVWKYLDNGSDQGTAWRGSGFNDSTWASGPAKLGYGDGDEMTVVSYGPSPGNKYVTTYFRQVFHVENASRFANLILRVMRDDGVVVYLNGVEIWRDSMPAGAINYLTRASVATEALAFVQATVASGALVNGLNVLAVEIHQQDRGSSDIGLDLQLLGFDPAIAASVIRGPYLQLSTPTSMVVRWRTSAPTDSRVNYGTTLYSLSQSVSDATMTTEHEVLISGLSPGTTYYYSVGTTTAILAGNTVDHLFVTSPPAGTPIPTRIWVLGDSGTAGSGQRATRFTYLKYTGNTPTNLWLMLGDNAYNSGFDNEYQTALFDVYPMLLRKSVLWPALGNHDTNGSETPPPNLPFHNNFTLPVNAEAGGLASGTEDYYSFDYGNIHFICIDSMSSGRTPGSPIITWLQNDLASTLQPWIIAYWHHPPYSKGSHNSDTEDELIEMRQNILPILEAGGVDLVLTGHSHSYERSFLINGHYGLSTTFTDSMKKNGGDGRADGNGVYTKSTYGPVPQEGTVYVVAGNGGQLGGGLFNHPAMFNSQNVLGSIILDINANRLDAKFLKSNGTIGDYFTIVKGPTSPPDDPSNLSATATSSSQINLAWTDNANNEDGFKIDQSLDGVNFAQVATVGANVTTYSATGLQAGTTYYFRVRSFNFAADSNYSNTASASTFQAPFAPSGLTATAISTSQISLAWADNASNEDGFKIERSLDGVNFTQVATVGANVTTYSATGLQAGTTYYFRVRSFNTGGDSGYSNTASATTPAATIPTAPSGVTVTAVSPSQLNVKWTDKSNNEDGFKIERCRGPKCNGYVEIAQVGPNVNTYSDTGLTTNTTYRYRVRAFNALGNSSYSNTGTAKTWEAENAVLIPTGSIWKYLDNGSNQETAWREVSFDDSTWASGPAKLGYGDNDEATVVSYGPFPGNKYTTTYFRHTFNVADASIFSSLILQVLRDDGIVVYLNGTEVWRDSMPSGNINYLTTASVATDATDFLEVTISSSLLVTGTNVLAVEIHQIDHGSSDIALDLQLIGGNGATGGMLMADAYLQLTAPFVRHPALAPHYASRSERFAIVLARDQLLAPLTDRRNDARGFSIKPLGDATSPPPPGSSGKSRRQEIDGLGLLKR